MLIQTLTEANEWTRNLSELPRVRTNSRETLRIIAFTSTRHISYRIDLQTI